ncbi:MAG: site-specific integrase [Acidobacteria bacterium]|nr:site-specific integrase [Acidobacteriota bacterium]MCA1638159.1 site-specific integrase [Acidobacteriota bacterium]
MKSETNKNTRDWGIIQKKDSSGKAVWYARITRIGGNGKKKQYTAKAESKSHARRLRDELAANYKDNGESSIDGSKMTFREFAEDYKERKLIPAKYHQNRKIAGLRSRRTAVNFLNNLLLHFGNKRIKTITPAEIEKFKQKRLNEPVKTRKKNDKGNLEATERPRAIAGVNRELALLRTMLNDAVYNGLLNRSPFLNAKGLVSLADEVKRERVLTFEEENRLLEACNEFITLEYERNGKKIRAKAKSNREHLKPLLIAALDTAMRSGELLKLRWHDVDFITRTINILAFNTKTAKARSVGMTQRVYDALTRIWEQSPKDLDELVFGIKNTVKRSFASACRDAGIEGFHFHDCRHTAITRLIQAGLTPMEVMKISGHTQMNTFARYVNPDTNAVQRIAERLSAFNTEAMNEVSLSNELPN